MCISKFDLFFTFCTPSLILAYLCESLEFFFLLPLYLHSVWEDQLNLQLSNCFPLYKIVASAFLSVCFTQWLLCQQLRACVPLRSFAFASVAGRSKRKNHQTECFDVSGRQASVLKKSSKEDRKHFRGKILFKSTKMLDFQNGLSFSLPDSCTKRDYVYDLKITSGFLGCHLKHHWPTCLIA